jgi:hypothetical protein
LCHIVSKDVISKVSCIFGVIFMMTLSLMLQGGVFVGLVTLVLAVGELDSTFSDETAREICVGLEF